MSRCRERTKVDSVRCSSLEVGDASEEGVDLCRFANTGAGEVSPWENHSFAESFISDLIVRFESLVLDVNVNAEIGKDIAFAHRGPNATGQNPIWMLMGEFGQQERSDLWAGLLGQSKSEGHPFAKEGSRDFRSPLLARRAAEH